MIARSLRHASAGVVLHHQFYVMLRERLLEGAYPVGRPLPSEPKLAEEFGHQIELHQLGNKTQAVDITFHSKSLPGLKVQIRQTRGQLAIRFLSQSVSTTELLSKHTANLQEALEDKGLRVASITLAGSRYPTSGPGSNHAAT